MARFTVTGGVVDIGLPPKSTPPSDTAARSMEEALGSVVAYHPRAPETYTFYEVLDQWLGPWGTSGYPIAYGKYYNGQFTRSQPLQGNPETRQWLERTTVCLQTALIEFCVRRFRAGTLAALTEPQLREAAFASHVDCYIRSGLSRVLLTDPFMIPLVAAVPVKEFVPYSGNAAASWSQALQAAVGTPAVTVGWSLALVMPAHSGVLRRAAELDAKRRLHLFTFFQRLGRLRADIDAGRLDYIPWLDQVIREVDRFQLTDPGERRFAREVLEAARRRRGDVLARYRRELSDAPSEVREQVERVNCTR